METKIKEVQDYFKNKILSGQFDIAEFHEFDVCVLIDKIYPFCIWVGRESHAEYCKLWDGRINFIVANQQEIGLDLTLKNVKGIDYNKIIFSFPNGGGLTILHSIIGVIVGFIVLLMVFPK